MKIYRGKILNFQGSWASGIANLIIRDLDTNKLLAVPCDNSPTIRALEACFGNVITEGHTANGQGYKGKEIFWTYDEFGLIFGGFIPVDGATPELWKLYKKSK